MAGVPWPKILLVVDWFILVTIIYNIYIYTTTIIELLPLFLEYTKYNECIK